MGTRCCPFNAARSTCAAGGVGERPAATRRGCASRSCWRATRRYTRNGITRQDGQVVAGVDVTMRDDVLTRQLGTKHCMARVVKIPHFSVGRSHDPRVRSEGWAPPEDDGGGPRPLRHVHRSPCERVVSRQWWSGSDREAVGLQMMGSVRSGAATNICTPSTTAGPTLCPRRRAPRSGGRRPAAYSSRRVLMRTVHGNARGWASITPASPSAVHICQLPAMGASRWCNDHARGVSKSRR